MAIMDCFMRGRPAALLMALALLPAALAFGQDAGPAASPDSGAAASASSDEEDVFGTDESVGQGAEGSNGVRDAFIQDAAPSLTGSYSGSLGLTGTWNDPWGGKFDLLSADNSALSSGSDLHLGFSAKPDKHLSFYGEVRTAYPFATTLSDGTKVPDISVFSLYSKFDWEDKLFFSFGKQNLKWGQGWFFTPANDILALDKVNLDDLGAEREGPLSLRLNAPIPKTMATAYLFAVMKSATILPSEIGIAPKFEFAFPAWEFSASGYYQRDTAPKAIASVSYADNGLSVFGEGVLSFGSDQWFVVKETRDITVPAQVISGVPVPAHPMTVNYRIMSKDDPKNLFLTGTVGLMYTKSWEKKLDLTLLAQYLYDGQSQDGVTLDDAAQALVEQQSVKAQNAAYDYPDDPVVDISSASGISTTVSKFGRLNHHYAGMQVSAGSLFGTDLSASVFALANLVDLSGWVKPQLSYKIFDQMSVSAWASFGFGDGGDEYTNLGGVLAAVKGYDFATGTYNKANFTPNMQLGLTFSLGSGSF